MFAEQSLVVPWWASTMLAGIAAAALLGWGPMLYASLSQRWKYRALKSPPSQLLAGNLPAIRQSDITQFLEQCAAQLGSLFVFWWGTQPLVVVGEAALGKRLMSRLTERSSMRYMFLLPEHQQRIVDKGILMMQGAPWRVARKAFEAAVMHHSAVSMHLQVMEQCVGRLLERITRTIAAAEQSGEDGGVFEATSFMGDLTLDVVGSCVFGVAFNTQEELVGEGGPGLMQSGVELPYSSRQLIQALRQVFTNMNISSQSRWSLLSSRLPARLWPLVRSLANRFPDTAQKELVHSRKVIIDTCRALIKVWEQDHPPAAAAAAAAPPEGTQPSSQASPISRVSEKSFLGLLLSSADMTTGTTLDHEQIIAQVFVFLLAGYETTATTLTFALYCLATNPEVQRKLQAEVDAQAHLLAQHTAVKAHVQLTPHSPTGAKGAAAGPTATGKAAAAGRSRSPSPSSATPDLAPASAPSSPDGPHHPESGQGLSAERLAADFPYACAVIDEAMRVFPPVAQLRRVMHEPQQLAGHNVPGESTLVLPIWSYHHDAGAWPRPDAFLPERHLAEQQSSLAPALKTHYMPFGAGARSCPGARFALQEARLAIVRLCSAFNFALAPVQEFPVKIRSGFTIAPAHGMWLKAQPRAQ
ncbi:cytochrome P450 [Haematococcus lacustris]